MLLNISFLVLCSASVWWLDVFVFEVCCNQNMLDAFCYAECMWHFNILDVFV